jgi:integrase
MTLELSASARQPERQPWPMRRLLEERAIALGFALENSTAGTYTSHLNSYLTFCNIHHLPIEPTADTLSFYIVFMCSHIKPTSVDSYLSGICSQLEPWFPKVREIRSSALVSRTLAGCKKMRGTSVTRKRPFSEADLLRLLTIYGNSPSYDDTLFLCIVFTAWHCLMRLGEIVAHDNPAYRSAQKTIKRCTVKISSFPRHISFFLPMHKADRLFEGSHVVLEERTSRLDPVRIFLQYIGRRDQRFPLYPQLWLRENGSIPSRSWFMHRIRSHFPPEYAGHSLRSGGATALAIAGIPADRIQAIGRWSSSTFQIYIRKNPVLLQALLGNAATFDQQRS